MDLSTNIPLSKEYLDKVHDLVATYRTQCLWFFREDYLPVTASEVMRSLKKIEEHADREGYIKARVLKEWLLHKSKAISAG